MRVRLVAPIALLATLAACGGPEPSADGMINDASDAAASAGTTSTELSPELRSAAAQSGKLACGLPSMPDARVKRMVSATSTTYNSDAKPEEVATFYRFAAEAQGSSFESGGPPGMADIAVTMADGKKCRIVAQAQLSGDTNVMVSLEN